MNKQLLGTFFTEDQVSHEMVQIRCTNGGSMYHTTNASADKAIQILKADMVIPAVERLWRMSKECDELDLDIHDYLREVLDITEKRMLVFGFNYKGDGLLLGGISYNIVSQAFEPVGTMTSLLYDMLEEVCKEMGDKWDALRKMKPAIL
ncbi:conserved hypothetical protein [Vibrio phage 150E35-1]|nr:conserved hypothetical protein [Vibrio phage 150E35-1]